MVKIQHKATSEPKVRQPVLRKVDLNLLTILIPYAVKATKRRTLGMSQPAVSSVSRLKVLFKDELFVRRPRDKPTERAFQLFALFVARCRWCKMSYRIRFSTRWTANVVNLCVCSPLDNYPGSLFF